MHIYMYVSGHKWSTTHIVLKFHRSKMCVICNKEKTVSCRLYIYIYIYISCCQKDIQFALLVITSPPMLHGNSCTWTHDNRTSNAQVHELLWSHWQIGNNREDTLSVFLTTYILRSSYFCRIWALWSVSRVTSNQFYIYIYIYIDI